MWKNVDGNRVFLGLVFFFFFWIGWMMISGFRQIQGEALTPLAVK